MPNYVGAPLARLIRERAYTAGALAKADGLVEAKRQEYRDALTQRRQTALRIAELDQKIRQHRLEPTGIRAISAAPRTSGLRHGSFMRELVAVLRQANGPVTTGDIIGHMLATFDFPYGAGTERDILRRRIIKRLGEMVGKGTVQRLHDPQKRLEGIWLWVGL